MRIEVKYEDLTEWHREMLLNGCGAQRGIKRWFDAPDWVFEEACNRHDFDYRVGGVRDLPGGESMARHEADVLFLRNMLDAANTAGWWASWWYRTMARSYHRLVVEYGRDAFEYRTRGETVSLETLIAEETWDVQQGLARAGSPFRSCMCNSGKWCSHDTNAEVAV